MGGFLNDVLNSQVEKRRMELLGGPDYDVKRRAGELTNLVSEQKFEQSELEAPLRRSEITSKIESREALSKTRNAKLELTKELEQAEQELIKAKMFPEEGSLQAREIEAKIAGISARSRMLDAQAGLYQARAADPAAFRAGGSGATGPVVKIFAGYNEEGAPQETYIPRSEAVGQTFAKAPTTEQVNTSAYESAVGPAFGRMRKSLERYKGARERGIGGTGLGGGVMTAIPTSQANFALKAFVDQSKALAANTARLAGEGSRLSDEDRRAYAAFQSIVDELPFILNEGAVDEAFLRLDQAEELLGEIMTRRQAAQGRLPVGSGTAEDLAGGGALPGSGGEGEGEVGPQIGDVKTFPNGRVGKWDGQGWEAVE